MERSKSLDPESKLPNKVYKLPTKMTRQPSELHADELAEDKQYHMTIIHLDNTEETIQISKF